MHITILQESRVGWIWDWILEWLMLVLQSKVGLLRPSGLMNGERLWQVRSLRLDLKRPILSQDSLTYVSQTISTNYHLFSLKITLFCL